MAARRRTEAFRIASPRLEPDDAFVAQLAEAARTSRPTAGARRQLQSLRVGLATAGVVGLTVGGAWAAGNLVVGEGQAPGPPPATDTNPLISPETTPGTPPGPLTPPSSPPGRGEHGQDRGRDHGRPATPGQQGKPDRGDRGRHLGRPDEHPGKGPGLGPEGPGKSHTHPQPGDHGKGKQQGPGGGRRPHSPG